MKSTLTSLITLLTITGCAFAPPAQKYDRPASTEASYGEYPADYKTIVLKYLKENPPKDGIEPSSIYFMNTPDRYADRSISSSETSYGYRVCIQGRTESITKKSNQLHFFLLNGNRVIKHSSATGLATFFDRQCSFGPQQAGAAQPTPAAAAPVSAAAAAPAAMDNSAPSARSNAVAPQAKQPLKYVVCEVNDSEMLLILDQEKNQLRQEIEGAAAGTFAIDTFTDTSIVATNQDGRLFLSRVSGKLIYRKGDQKIVGTCDSSSGTKY